MSVRASVIALVIMAGIPAAQAGPGDPPFVTGITWHPRTGTPADPILHVSIAYDAPEGLASGEVRLGSVWHEVLTTIPLDGRGPGPGTFDVAFSPPGDKPRPWDVIGITLHGADGQTVSEGFCELASRMETRENPSKPRLDVRCLDGPGWVVYTVRAGADPDAILWSQGVATRNHTYAGTGHVMQDAAGVVVTWGTAVTVAYPQAHEGTHVRAGDITVVDEPAPDPSAQPGPNRIVVGVGGSTPDTLVPGATYRWATYFAVRPGHFDLPFISLEGADLEVLDVEQGTSAGIAWGKDFDHAVAVQRSEADAAVFADGSLTRSFTDSTTCMFAFVAGRIGDLAAANASRIEGPSAPPVGGVVVAGQPGEYRFHAVAGAGQSWSQHAVACADMPLMPQAGMLTSGS